MATEKRNDGIDKSKLKTMEMLKKAGFDTANKIKSLDGRIILKNDLTSEMANIFDLQDAIKANHGEIGWFLDGEDPKPLKKEAAKNDHNDRHTGESNREETGRQNQEF